MKINNTARKLFLSDEIETREAINQLIIPNF